MKHKKDTVSDGIHDYATNMKPKTYQISLFFLKIYYHQERIEIQFFRILLGSYTLDNTLSYTLDNISFLDKHQLSIEVSPAV